MNNHILDLPIIFWVFEFWLNALGTIIEFINEGYSIFSRSNFGNISAACFIFSSMILA